MPNKPPTDPKTEQIVRDNINGYIKMGVAETAAEQLRKWDAGETIWSISMGGLGPGYEQAIQVLAIEIVRDNINGYVQMCPDDSPMPKNWGDSTVRRVDRSLGGLSGAQAGAARKLAFEWLRVGPASVHANQELNDRHIQVSNRWPKV